MHEDVNFDGTIKELYDVYCDRSRGLIWGQTGIRMGQVMDIPVCLVKIWRCVCVFLLNNGESSKDEKHASDMVIFAF